jgi:hypothetical protein
MASGVPGWIRLVVQEQLNHSCRLVELGTGRHGAATAPTDPDPPRRAPATPSATPAQPRPSTSRPGLPRPGRVAPFRALPTGQLPCTSFPYIMLGQAGRVSAVQDRIAHDWAVDHPSCGSTQTETQQVHSPYSPLVRGRTGARDSNFVWYANPNRVLHDRYCPSQVSEIWSSESRYLSISARKQAVIP